MTPDDMPRELAVALTAADLASEYLRREYAAFAPVPNAPADISTHADKGSQEIILRHLHVAFPADGLLAEEATDTLRTAPVGTSGRMWIVDPIDGTRGFASKNGQFSVMIGLERGGRAVLGVVAEPVVGRVTFAADGLGCWVRDDAGTRRCAVTAVGGLADCTLARSFGREPASERLLKPRATVPTHSAGIKLALVARGEADVYVNDHAGYCDWDVCAGEALVWAAGGRVSAFDGSPIRYGPGGPRRTGGLLATNGVLHPATVAALAAGG